MSQNFLTFILKKQKHFQWSERKRGVSALSWGTRGFGGVYFCIHQKKKKKLVQPQNTFICFNCKSHYSLSYTHKHTLISLGFSKIPKGFEHLNPLGALCITSLGSSENWSH